MNDSRIVFFDPDASSHAAVVDHLHRMGLNPIVCESAELIRQLRQDQKPIELAVVGSNKPNGCLSEALDLLRQMDPEMVMICATEPTPQAEDDALSMGVDEIIVRPYSLTQLEGAVRMGLEMRRLREETRRLRELLECRQTFHGLIGGSEPMMAMYRYLEQIALSNAPVLIHSEPGTEIQEAVVALHRCSDHAEAMVKRFDASYLEPGDLAGFLRQASVSEPGTLWIDNIERLNPFAQEILLSLLSGEGNPGGWRLVTSSDHDLTQAVESHLFRRDLFYRINVFLVRIPPLRERLEDLPLLAADRLRSKCRLGMPVKRLSYRALMAAAAYEWPRNVAEFDAALRYASERTRGEIIEPESLPPDISMHARKASLFMADCSLRDAKAQFEMEYYRDLLRRTNGNMSQASKISKVGRPYLYKKIRECNLDPEAFRAQ